MKTARLITAVLLSFVMLFFTACSHNKVVEDSENQSSQDTSKLKPTLQLLYCSSDTLNPFNTKNKLNIELGRLIYEPLFSLSNDFEAIAVLADSITENEKVYTIKLISARFSDGSSITAEDVIASYNLAKESELYSHLFYNIDSVAVVDSTSVSFTLKTFDPYFTNLLTFPIIKKDTDKLTDSDNVEIAPTGSGKFVFSKEEKALLLNKNYHGQCDIERINLVDAPDSEAVAHYVEVGATDLYYTDPVNGNIIRMSGQRASLNMNNLVYIGINHSKGKLSDPVLRQALSAAIDRTTVATAPYYGNALPASGFFHPAFKPTEGYQTIQLTADNKISVENLIEIGYNNLDKDGFRVNDKGELLEFELLVNEENSARVAAAELIKTQLSAVGVKINVNAVPSETYFAALSEENFELYIGEIKMSQNMDMSELVLPGGSCAYGIIAPVEEEPESEEEKVRYYADVLTGVKEGRDPISSLATSLVTDMPVIPIVYRNSLLFYSENVSNIGDASAYDIFLSVNSFIKKP